MTSPRRETRNVAIKLSRVDWTWIVRDLMRRHMRLDRYLAQVVEGEIAMQRELRGETRPRASTRRLLRDAGRADRPILAHER